MSTAALQPYVSDATQPPVHFLGIPTVIRATGASTGGAFGLIEHWDIPPGFASPYHTHQREDEAFYVLQGSLAIVCDGQWTIAPAGTYVFGPRGVAHGFKAIGNSPVRMLLLCAPGGFEQFIVELSRPVPAPPDMAALAAVAAKYHIDIHGPLPAMPDHLGSGAA